jgi:hypothetical protein
MQPQNASLITAAAALGLALSLASCGHQGNGTISAVITDAAVDDVSAVILRVIALQLRPQGAPEDGFITIDVTDPNTGEPVELNLLDYQQGETFTLFEDEEVPAGVYEHARLVLQAPAQTPGECALLDPLAGSHVVENGGGEVPIFVPSGAQTGVKLASPFRVPENGSTEIVVDFNLCQALHRPSAQTCYFLRPAFRVEAVQNTGRIAGTVEPTLLDNSNGLCSDSDPATGNAVYIYEGAGQTPGDLDAVADGDADPFATARVELNTENGAYGYRAAFLPPGDYTVAFTCKADQERLPDPDAATLDLQQANDLLDFQEPQDATVEAGATEVVNFPPTAPAP